MWKKGDSILLSSRYTAFGQLACFEHENVKEQLNVRFNLIDDIIQIIQNSQQYDNITFGCMMALLYNLNYDEYCFVGDMARKENTNNAEVIANWFEDNIYGIPKEMIMKMEHFFREENGDVPKETREFMTGNVQLDNELSSIFFAYDWVLKEIIERLGMNVDNSTAVCAFLYRLDSKTCNAILNYLYDNQKIDNIEKMKGVKKVLVDNGYDFDDKTVSSIYKSFHASV